jgi:formylglycine-generating enzyme required for sulfatase activity
MVESPVPAFTVDSVPVGNGDFLEFLDSGGYRRPELWRPVDWAWRVREGREHPAFWEQSGKGFACRTVFDLLPLDRVAGWPAYVSLAEARAFARWRGGRLPSEVEFHRAAYGQPDGGDRAFPWSDDRGAADGGGAAGRGNFGFRHWAPAPRGSHPDGASAWGIHELVGNGWEWTDTTFDGFPGFSACTPGYPGYSADFFDGKHFVLKGASWATDATLVRPSFRNWYQAHYPYVFAKFRCVSPTSRTR